MRVHGEPLGGTRPTLAAHAARIIIRIIGSVSIKGGSGSTVFRTVIPRGELRLSGGAP